MNNSSFHQILHGLSFDAYRLFGAHFSKEYEQSGVRFTVYAPNAKSVSLIGTFNDWNGWQMEQIQTGIWSIFAKDVCEGALYKYQITTQQNKIYDRIDPFAFFSEVRPNTASIVYSIENHIWNDHHWIDKRSKSFDKPVSIYEIHAGSWKKHQDGQFYTYTELAQQLIPYLKEHGFTHLELLPLTEHPLDASWGYQTTGYFSPTSRYGSPRQLMEMIDLLHQAEIGVILDFVPAHFVTDFYALHQFDGGYVYESEIEQQRFSEWKTALFDFTKPYVLSFLKSALHFWIHYYHFDGIRFDAVANLIYHNGRPENGFYEAGIWFLKNVNYTLQQECPQVMFIAEDSSSYLKVTAPVVYGGLGFDYKWNLGWMHDILQYLSLPPQQRHAHHRLLTLSIEYFYQEVYLLPFSHDEVVHGKKTIIDKLYGNYQEKFHQLRCLYLYMFTHPGKKLNFMGNELAEFQEWNVDKQLGWNLLDYPAHQAFLQFFTELQSIYQQQTALFSYDYHPEAFCWIDGNNSRQSIIAYSRQDFGGHIIYAVFNFSNHFYPNYLLRVNQAGIYQEILNTDDIRWGGSGVIHPTISSCCGCEIPLALSPYSGCLLTLQS